MLTVAHVAMAGQITGRVVGIADGDTLTVLDGTLTADEGASGRNRHT